MRKKPFPDPILLALEKLKVSKASEISAGDKAINILGSQAARVKSIGCLWGCADSKALIDSAPDFVARNASDFGTIL